MVSPEANALITHDQGLVGISGIEEWRGGVHPLAFQRSPAPCPPSDRPPVAFVDDAGREHIAAIAVLGPQLESKLSNDRCEWDVQHAVEKLDNAQVCFGIQYCGLLNVIKSDIP
jgi:hypothetical protein